MTTLFTVSRSWHESAWLFENLAFASPGDAILLIEDGVLACHSPITLASFVAKCSANKVKALVLKDDLVLRGLNNHYCDIAEISYADFVNLVIEFDKQVSW